MPPTRSTTSYALLGLLSVRPWTTYELAKQVQRSLNWFWPRAERKLYDEPKRLVADGLATAEEQYTGRRRKTVYEITEHGRDELAGWLTEPASPRMTEFEAMIKVFFSDSGDLDQLRTTLERIEAEAQARLLALAEMAGEPASFPERRHLSAVCLRLQHDQEKAVRDWAAWAQTQVRAWASTTDPGSWDAQPVLESLGESAGPA